MTFSNDFDVFDSKYFSHHIVINKCRQVFRRSTVNKWLPAPLLFWGYSATLAQQISKKIKKSSKGSAPVSG
jgi:hypothetical protein